MRITRPLFEKIEHLLKENRWSQRRIARETGVSRSTVNNIARGYRPRCEELPGEMQPTGPLVRCPGCGGRVLLPCVLCHIRELKEQDRQLRNGIIYSTNQATRGRKWAPEQVTRLPLNGEVAIIAAARIAS